MHGVLNFLRVDVLAATDDHVLQSVDDIDKTVLVHPGAVASVHPTVANCRGCCLGLVPVAQHDLSTAHRDLAGSAARQFVTVQIHDPDIYAVGRPPCC